jgi:hypothetical protein
VMLQRYSNQGYRPRALGSAAVAGGLPAYGIEPSQDSWYRCWLSHTATATGSTNFRLALNNGASYAGDGSSALYLSGAQFEAGARLQLHQNRRSPGRSGSR